jgi:S-DNA-T family DNA segregation ATPase FtsK/SpoIIIE
LHVQPIPGRQAVTDIITAAPHLATYWHHPVIAETTPNSTTVTLTVCLRSAYAEPRPADFHADHYTVRLGRLDTGHDLRLDLSQPSSLIIQGQTRSAKTSAVRLIIAALAHDPTVVIAGLDPTGQLLGPLDHLPHPEWRHTGTQNMAHAALVLQRLEAEMDKRIHQLSQQHLAQMDCFSPTWPLILVVLEEFSGVISAAGSDDAATARKPADRLEPQIRRSLGRLLAEGLKAGIRVVILAQRAEANTIGGTERSNIATRITFRVDNRDSVHLLHPAATPELCDQITALQAGYGLIESPWITPSTQFRLDCATYQDYLTALSLVQK